MAPENETGLSMICSRYFHADYSHENGLYRTTQHGLPDLPHPSHQSTLIS